MNATDGLTAQIRRMQQGDGVACSNVFVAAAQRLKRIASSLLAREPHSGSFDVSDLLQEAYLKKVYRFSPNAVIRDRNHFFSMMAHGMEQLLIDRSRARNAQKRVAPFRKDRSVPAKDERLNDLAWFRARLRKLDPKAHMVLALRTEGGLSWEAIATRMGLSVWECRVQYRHAVNWLRQHMKE